MATATDTKNCILCRQEDVDIFAVGKCDHPVCYRCSTKMRVLYEQRYCSVCREDLDEVAFVRNLDGFAALLAADRRRLLQREKKHGIYFGDGQIRARFRSLLLSECSLCPVEHKKPPVFSRFAELKQHMRRRHELSCCDVCTRHLKVFPHERKWYGRNDLALHCAQGDRDDTSHRGHPLCRFCKDRHLDNDELLKHLRQDHYFCHFCDGADGGGVQFYQNYRCLSGHFRQKHYLCEEGDCAAEKFVHAFRTEVDYKAHKVAAHSKTRAEAKQNGHLDLRDVRLLRRPRDGGRSQQAHGGGQRRSSSYQPTPEPIPEPPPTVNSNALDRDDEAFPALGASVATPTIPLSSLLTWSKGKAQMATSKAQMATSKAQVATSKAQVATSESSLEKNNGDLSQSIKNYLHDDESQFKQFMKDSRQFRQGLISAGQYHRICRFSLGEKNFDHVFNELLALLPDTKRQELLMARKHDRALERRSGAAGSRQNDVKSAWQTASPVVVKEDRCAPPPTSRQTRLLQDFNSQRPLHVSNNEEFPSLQSISRMIS